MSETRLVFAMAHEMAKKLDANRGKTPWNELSPRWLLNRLRQEVGELERAVERGADPRQVWAEAADVANFAAMAADVFEEAALQRAEELEVAHAD